VCPALVAQLEVWCDLVVCYERGIELGTRHANATSENRE
jgi:hypothetical protein